MVDEIQLFHFPYLCISSSIFLWWQKGWDGLAQPALGRVQDLRNGPGPYTISAVIKCARPGHSKSKSKWTYMSKD